MASNDLKTSSNEPVEPRKNRLKGGASVDIIEFYLGEILHNTIH